MRGKEVAKIAKTQGWVEVRSRGSHHTFRHPERPDHLVIPWANTGRELSSGLVKQIMCQLEHGERRVKV
jgi:predicted RNA binding protein YcfA (HicA-like mRNA interferase family)